MKVVSDTVIVLFAQQFVGVGALCSSCACDCVCVHACVRVCVRVCACFRLNSVVAWQGKTGMS